MSKQLSAAAKLDRIRTRVSLVGPKHRITCSSAVLYDLGVLSAEDLAEELRNGGGPRRSGKQIAAALETAGRRVERLWADGDSAACPTLAQFMAEHPQGRYVLVTGVNQGAACHSMALVDGRLTDTDLAGTSRRRVNIAYRVES